VGHSLENLIVAHIADLGGPEDLSEAQASIVKRVSTIECQLEGMEARLSEGQVIDIAVYARLTGVLARLLDLVGVKRRAPLDPQAELVRAMAAFPVAPIGEDGEDDEALPIEEPGEA
jgi:hypothetical protein